MEFVRLGEEGEGEDKARKKISHQLLLNTPGACFLCLQDNQTTADEDLNGGLIDISSICRYLNIDQRSLLLTSLQDDEGVTSVQEDVERAACAFSVNLCPKCLSLTGKLVNQIIELERAKLMVNYHLKKFHKLLEGDEGGNWEESLEWINLLGRMLAANQNNQFEAKLVQLLREEAKEKAFKSLEKAEAARPQVILSKLSAALPPPPPPSTSKSGGTSPTSIKTLLSQLTTSSAIPSNKSPHRSKVHHRCPFCLKILSISKFPIHVACLHSDKLLSSHFPPPLSPPSESICRQFLHSEVIRKAPKIRSQSTPKAPRYGCYLCGITYSDGTLVKHHFLISHTDKLLQELKTFTKNSQNPNKTKKKVAIKVNKLIAPRLPRKTHLSLNPSSQPPNSVENLIKNLKQDKLMRKKMGRGVKIEDKPLGKLKKRSAEEKTCKICGVRFKQVWKLRRHLVGQHPEKLFEECRPEGMGEGQWRGKCKEVFGGEVKKATFGKPGGKIFRCGWCPGGKTSYKGKDEFLVHLAYMHREEMEEKLREEVEGMEMGEEQIVLEEEEDGGDFQDVKPDVGELNGLLYPDMMLNEFIEGEEGGREEGNGDLEYFQQQYGYFEEEGGGGGDNEVDDSLMIGNMMEIEEPVKLTDGLVEEEGVINESETSFLHDIL